MRHLNDNDKVFICLDRGEDLFSSLENLATQENWQTAYLSGIGAVEDVELGLYNPKTKAYDRKNFPQVAELLSLDGNLTLKDGKPFFHLHAVLSGQDYRCYGGHLFSAKIAAVCEINLQLVHGKVTRNHNANIGLFDCKIH